MRKLPANTFQTRTGLTVSSLSFPMNMNTELVDTY